MKPLAVLAFLALAGCGPLSALTNLAGSGPQLNTNVLAGPAPSQNIGQTRNVTITRPQGRVDASESRVRAEEVDAVTINEGFPAWFVTALIVIGIAGWILPTPQQMGEWIGAGVKKPFESNLWQMFKRDQRGEFRTTRFEFHSVRRKPVISYVPPSHGRKRELVRKSVAPPPYPQRAPAHSYLH